MAVLGAVAALAENNTAPGDLAAMLDAALPDSAAVRAGSPELATVAPVDSAAEMSGAPADLAVSGSAAMLNEAPLASAVRNVRVKAPRDSEKAPTAVGKVGLPRPQAAAS